MKTKRLTKILTVDDEQIMRDFLSEVLTDEGYLVSTAQDAEAALEKMKEDSFEIVITDIRMPGMGGIEFIKKIKDLDPKIDVIVMTGYASPESAIAAMKLGTIDYITKPVNIDHIRIVVEKTENKRRLEQKALETEFYKKLSQVDSLTGVFNHQYFQEILKAEIERAKKYNRQLSLIMIDVDNFKIYNDKNGHPMGDFVLKKIVWLIKNTVRESDFVARYGGEEFCVILPDTSLAGAAATSERLRNAVLAAQFDNEEILPQKKITISLGIASCPQHALTREELIEKADKALYKAKTSGKNKTCLSGE